LPVQSVPLTANTITIDPSRRPPTKRLKRSLLPSSNPLPVTKKERATLAQLVAAHRASDVANRELECLAGAIYFESKGEPLPGQVAVGQVIVNRAKSGRFPTSYCGVVFQRSQFSFVRGRALPPIPRSSAHWKTAVAVAHRRQGPSRRGRPQGAVLSRPLRLARLEAHEQGRHRRQPRLLPLGFDLLPAKAGSR
jgi:hypothetical protein